MDNKTTGKWAAGPSHTYRKTRRGGRACLIRDDGKVITGTARDLREENGTAQERAEWARALRQLRRCTPPGAEWLGDRRHMMEEQRRDFILFRQGRTACGYSVVVSFTREERNALFEEARAAGVTEGELLRRLTLNRLNRQGPQDAPQSLSRARAAK